MEEKLAFLKREEIRTMAKDLVRLQEQAALAQREKVADLKIAQKVKQELIEREKIANTIIPSDFGVKQEEVEDLLPKIKKPSSFQKIFVRIFIGLAGLGFLFLLGFGVWFLVTKRGKPLQPSPLPTPTVPTISPSIVSSPTPSSEPPSSPNIPPIPLIKVKEIKLVRLTETADPKTTTLEIIKTVPTQDNPEFYELLLEKDGKFLSPKDFFDNFKIGFPEGFWTDLSTKPEDFDLLLYPKTNNLRLGFLVKTTDAQKTISLFRSRESRLENDWETILVISGKNKPALYRYFRQTSYKDVLVRYLTVSKQDLGLCYASYNDYFILTTSFESIKKIIDQLK